MGPIRVALVGLSATAKTSWAAQAHLPYLLSEHGEKHYQITALLNSSVQAAELAKVAFNLPNAKAYGDPVSLAADADVDLVVVATRVDVHFSCALPSVEAGKAVFVEWPLTHDLASSLKLTGGRSVQNSIVALQARVTPLFLRLKEILTSAVIGKVLNSEVRAYGNVMPRSGIPAGVSYFADRKVGGNAVSIFYGHFIAAVKEVLGNWETFHVEAQIQRPVVPLLGTDETIETDVPDYISVHGKIKCDSGITVPGALLTLLLRVGPPFKNEPGFVWTINGEVGELKVTAPGIHLHSGDSYSGPVKIDLHDHSTDELTELAWDWPEWQKELPLRARNTGELYERFAEWVENGRPEVSREWPRLDDGVEVMKELDELFRQFEFSK
ncbi:oxidoreductase family protein [Cladochytrium replicatum]|nr:oxidoreductase family protein [Cladochytrium replicatum]